MSRPSALRCLVDDTVLTRNITELETWVSQGDVILVVPLYTLERLHILKKEPSEIGANARRAVKFLDRSTSSRGALPHDPVILQGPHEQYPTWAEVEARYANDGVTPAALSGTQSPEASVEKRQEKGLDAAAPNAKSSAGGALSQLLLEKLNFSKDADTAASPASTPPLSPSSSGPQSSKTSPEVKSATMAGPDQTPVPPMLKPLLNPVVWYVHEKKVPGADDLIFLTNSADTMHLARDFGVATKNIHQLRSTLGYGEVDARAPESPKKEVLKRTSRTDYKAAPVGLFSYDDGPSDDEEVVFKPRLRGAPRGHPTRGAGPGTGRAKVAQPRSRRTSFNATNPSASVKPQIPVEEIDPDSFDRGSFARGSVPLANTSNHAPSHHAPPFNAGRGSATRVPSGPAASRGSHPPRGSGRGGDRGSTRGRGRLFVP